ncbi:MAG: HAMP domain-containing sensor histidine kinase [Rikenellaceae bacterium]
MIINHLLPDLKDVCTFNSKSDSESPSVKISNNVAILIGLCVFFSFGLFFFYEDSRYYKDVIFFISLYVPLSMIVFYINYKKFYFLAGLLLNLIFTFLFFGLSGIFFGKTPGLHFYFLLFSLIPLLTFKLQRVVYVVTLMVINVSCFGYVQYFKPSDEFLLVFPESSVSLFENISTALLFLMLILIILVNQVILQNKEKRLKKQADEISRKNVELTNLNMSKDRFFSIIAHDLRGPVGTISTFLDYLADTSNNLTSDQFTESLEVIKRSSQDIYNLLENLLTWSRIQYGNIVFNRQNYNLTELIAANITLFKPMTNQKNINLVNRAEDHDYFISIDKEMINTVLRNMLNNALKFTNNGGEIVVSVKRDEDYITVSIADNGLGMKKETIDNLFKIEIKQNNILGTQGEKGTGLGLILCKQFVERHGGEISIKSEIGRGSEFSFTIPVCH